MMKKRLLWGLAMLMVLSLFGCTREYPEDTFFDTAILEEYQLSDMPVPKLENSRLDGDSLCLNLTDEEYEAYVAELVAWLRGREDVYSLCYYHSRYLMGEIAPVDVCAPLPQDYDCSGDWHEFVFTYTEILDENRMKNPIRITVLREVRELFRGNFTYNTEIFLEPDSAIPAEVDPCAGSHTYDEGTVYPVPGWDRGITIYSCIHCGDTKQSEYIDSSYKSYAVTVTEGVSYILSNNWNIDKAWAIEDMFAGQEIEITTPILADGTIQMLVNGENIPVLWTEGETQTFGFIMPQENVEIQILVLSAAAGE